MNIGRILLDAGAAVLPSAAEGTASAGRTRSTHVGHAAVAGALRSAAAAAAGGGRALTQKRAQRQAEQLGALLGRIASGALGVTAPKRSSTAGGAKGAASGVSSGRLDFLKDPRLSVEEKLARLMVLLSDKYEKELEKKLQQYADVEAGKKTGGASKAGGSGGSSGSSLLGSLTSGLSSLVSKTGLGELVTGALLPRLATQVAAPVLAGAATALGLPALAPLLLQAGPLIGGLADGVMSLAEGVAGGSKKASSSGGGGSSGGGSSSGSSSAAGAPSEKQLMVEIQILQEKQKEMFGLVSNILRSMHDAKMSVIANVR